MTFQNYAVAFFLVIFLQLSFFIFLSTVHQVIQGNTLPYHTWGTTYLRNISALCFGCAAVWHLWMITSGGGHSKAQHLSLSFNIMMCRLVSQCWGAPCRGQRNPVEFLSVGLSVPPLNTEAENSSVRTSAPSLEQRKRKDGEREHFLLLCRLRATCM